MVQKNSWFQKSHEELGQLQASSGKSKKLRFDGLHLRKKYIPSAKTYILSNIIFNYLSENSPNYLRNFWNHKSLLTTHFLCIFFSSNITYFLQKYPIKVQIFRLSTVRVKVYQISHVIFETKSQFFFNLWILFQCHERLFFCTFLAETLYAIEKGSTLDLLSDFQTCHCSH